MMKVLISACLMGENVRFDGKNRKKCSEVIKKWKKEDCLVFFCPEVAGGLPVPRPPAEIQSDGRIITIDDENVTAAFELGAQKALALCKQYHIRTAILKEGSPSCGSSLINDGSFSHRKIPGRGVTTQLLEDHGVRVFSEDDLEKAEVYLRTID